MIIKKRNQHDIKNSPFCGAISVVSTILDNPDIDFAIVNNIKPTKAHFHNKFQEIYIVVDGTLKLDFYKPETDEYFTTTLESDEMAMIPPGVHHRITEASEENRLYVFCLPGFNPEDEQLSHKL